MTDGLAYLAAIAVAVVLAYSAIAKFRDTHPTRRALVAAGAPGSSAIARAIPFVESAIAITLIVRPAIGAYASLILFSVFTLFVLFLLARKLDVSCGCFGTNATKSVSVIDVLRNTLLISLAALATSVTHPTGFALQEVIAATTTIAIAVVVLAAVGTRRELGQLFDNRLPGER